MGQCILNIDYKCIRQYLYEFIENANSAQNQMQFPKWSAIRSFSEIMLQKWNPLVVSVNDIFYLIQRENDWGQCLLQFREFMLSVELLIVIFNLFTEYILMWKIDGCHLGKLTNTMIVILHSAHCS